MTYGDYYVDVYWKKKRIATEIRLREPQEDKWFSPDETLKYGHQDAGFKADAAKFDKKTNVKIALKLAEAIAQAKKQTEKPEEEKKFTGGKCQVSCPKKLSCV